MKSVSKLPSNVQTHFTANWFLFEFSDVMWFVDWKQRDEVCWKVV